MLDGLGSVPRVISVGSFRPSDTPTAITEGQESGFVGEHDLLPICFGPLDIFLGESQSFGFHPGGQEGLGGWSTARKLQIFLQTMLDGPNRHILKDLGVLSSQLTS